MIPQYSLWLKHQSTKMSIIYPNYRSKTSARIFHAPKLRTHCTVIGKGFSSEDPAIKV